uniref:lipopolysaccharide-binding protein-like n=1 Tax=Ciona intestinalis TaxID=7719 RepID=UPI000EF5589D|nr:lipopolysaccharide-binding protein-like [Ciona intestinalis]|eukprot:XP_026696215.1 lipopolysaccharide-binding protein-like [Ciona intestinalis]
MVKIWKFVIGFGIAAILLGICGPITYKVLSHDTAIYQKGNGTLKVKVTKDGLNFIEIPVWSNIIAVVSLAQAPVVNSNSIQILAKGRCFPKNKPDIKYPFSSSAISIATGTDQMTDVVIGDFFLRSFVHSLWLEKGLDIWVTNDMLPEKYHRMVVETLSTFISGSTIYKGRPIKFRVNVTKSPDIQIGAGIITGAVQMDLLTYVVLPDQTQLLGMSLQGAAVVSGTVSIDNSKFTARVTRISASIMSTKISLLGKVVISVLNSMIPSLSRSYAIPAINNKLRHGYPLPTFTAFSYQTPRLHIIKGALVGSCDWKIKS